MAIRQISKIYIWCHCSNESTFKILLFTFKCLHDQAPKYLWDLLTWWQPKALWSDKKLLLVVPKSRHLTYCDHAFSIAAPSLWNVLIDYIKLTVNIGVFKCHLKTMSLLKSLKFSFCSHTHVRSSSVANSLSVFYSV